MRMVALIEIRHVESNRLEDNNCCGVIGIADIVRSVGAERQHRSIRVRLSGLAPLYIRRADRGCRVPV